VPFTDMLARLSAVMRENTRLHGERRALVVEHRTLRDKDLAVRERLASQSAAADRENMVERLAVLDHRIEGVRRMVESSDLHDGRRLEWTRRLALLLEAQQDLSLRMLKPDSLTSTEQHPADKTSTSRKTSER